MSAFTYRNGGDSAWMTVRKIGPSTTSDSTASTMSGTVIQRPDSCGGWWASKRSLPWNA